MTELAALEARIEHAFHRRQLLALALTHRSAGRANLERLEFLGDAVLDLIISEYLYRHFAEAGEGQLTRLRAKLVCKESLVRVARTWRLGEHVCVGGGERDAAGRIRSPAILADAVEAVIAAVYLDGGWQAAKKLVLSAWQQCFANMDMAVDVKDAKTRLQEFTQAQGWGLPQYQVEDRGSQAAQRFSARCQILGQPRGEGEGATKKAAEAAAAERAWQALTHASK